MAEMSDSDRIEQAQARIAKAMERVRRGAAYPRAPVSASRLIDSHERMREKVSDALGELDLLIERVERQSGRSGGTA